MSDKKHTQLPATHTSNTNTTEWSTSLLFRSQQTIKTSQVQEDNKNEQLWCNEVQSDIVANVFTSLLLTARTTRKDLSSYSAQLTAVLPSAWHWQRCINTIHRLQHRRFNALPVRSQLAMRLRRHVQYTPEHKRREGGLAPLGFEIFSKKRLFFYF